MSRAWRMRERFASPSVVSIRSIVDERPTSLTNVITPVGRRLRSDSSAMKSMIGALSSWLAVLSMQLPPHNGLCRLKSPAIITFVCGSRSFSCCTSSSIVRSLLLSSSLFSSLVLVDDDKSRMYTETTINFLPPTCATTAVISAESTYNCPAFTSLDPQMHVRTGYCPSRLPCGMYVVQLGFVPCSTTSPSARKHPGSCPRMN